MRFPLCFWLLSAVATAKPLAARTAGAAESPPPSPAASPQSPQTATPPATVPSATAPSATAPSATAPTAAASSASRRDAESAPAPAAANAAWSAAQPLTLARAGGSYLNLSLVGDVAAGGATRREFAGAQPGGHDPAARGFTVQGLEAVFEGAVDNYFRASANLVYGLDADGESSFEMEEAYAETLALPGGLQLRAGQFLTEFGRENTRHPHARDFVDSPLVLARLLGADGLRSPGARLAWLAPTPFYSEFFFGAQNSGGSVLSGFRGAVGGHSHEGGGGHDDDHDDDHGAPAPGAEGTAFGRAARDAGIRGLGDLLYSARYAVSFEPAETQTILAGVSGAWSPNSAGARTQIYGADVFWKWKPLSHEHGFPFVTFQAEAMLRGSRAAAATLEADGADSDHDGDHDAHEHIRLPAETVWDWGLYAQIACGFRRGWVAGLRADYVAPLGGRADYEKILGADDPFRARHWRLSPMLTWYPSEFSRVRLQYNYDRLSGGRDSHGAWLQIEFLLGAHAAHKF